MNMKFTKDIDDKITQQSRLIQDELGKSAITRIDIFDTAAKSILQTLTPLQVAQISHPGCRPVALADVPAAVLEDHRCRYTEEDLREGQFVIVTGSQEHYVFIMGHATKRRKDRERKQ